MKQLAAFLLAASWLSAAEAAPMLRPVVSSHGSYGETFTFMADLADGEYLHVSLGLTNIGPGSLKAICRAVLVQADGKVWKASTHVGRDRWSWQGGDEERLAIGPCAAEVAGAGTRVEVALDGATLQLAFAARPHRLATPDTTVVVGRDTYRSEVLLARVPVTATIALPGQPPRTVTGGGYADHSRSTVKPRDLARRWVRFRAVRGSRGLLVLGRQGHDGTFGPVWACEDPGSCQRYPSFRLERAGKPREPTFRVVLGDGPRELEIASGRLLYRDAPVEDLGLLGKLVAPFVGSPVTYVYRARATPADAPPVEGILEVELASE